jgi:hypothetical protein
MSNYPQSSAIIPKNLRLSPFMSNYLQLRSARRDLGHFVRPVFGLPWAKLTQKLAKAAKPGSGKLGTAQMLKAAKELLATGCSLLATGYWLLLPATLLQCE